jgi:uncharacterized membrane protein YcaP (DUF421 family)
MDIQELAMTALRAMAIYVILLVIIRTLGKRTVGPFSAFDLIVALILGEVVDEPIFGDVPFVQGIVAIVVVAAMHFLNSYFSFKSPAFDRLTGGEPTILVKDGQMQRDGMAETRTNEEELWSMLREQQIEELAEVKRGTLEMNGKLSVIRADDRQTLEKRDLEQLLKTQKPRPEKAKPDGQ